jgi:hypothetical protein
MQANQKIVFYYKELVIGSISGELQKDNMPFVIGLQDNFQFATILGHNHQSTILVDATISTNHKKVTFHTWHFRHMSRAYCHSILLRGLTNFVLEHVYGLVPYGLRLPVLQDRNTSLFFFIL